jgi:peroxin-2
VKSLVKPDFQEEEETSLKGELAYLPARTCAICYQDQNPTSATENEIIAFSAASGGVVGSAHTDITNPYETVPCGCIYCFTCLAKRLEAEEGEGCICLRCGELFKECKPWAGDVLETTLASTHKKTVSFLHEEKSQDGDEKTISYNAMNKQDNSDNMDSRLSGVLMEAEGAWEGHDPSIDVSHG